MWALFEEGDLTPNSVITGEFDDDGDGADVDAVLEEIKAVMQEEQDRQDRIREAEEDA
jgi:RIO kinase 1